MDRSQKIMLLLAAALVIWMGFTLQDDWVHFNESLPVIMAANHVSDPEEARHMFLGVIFFRCALFLIPAFILSFTAVVMYIHDNSVPGKRFSFIRPLRHRPPESGESGSAEPSASGSRPKPSS